METIKINDKEYLLDIEQAKSRGVLIEKNIKPQSWEEYVEATSGIVGNKASLHYSDAYGNQYDIFKNVDEARAFNALGKLIQLRDAWIGKWRPDWTNSNSTKYVIYQRGGKFNTDFSYDSSYVLAFPTEEMRDDFLSTFRDLIEQAKMFL